MNTMKKIIIASLMALPVFTACTDDDYNAPAQKGNPIVTPEAVSSAEMGETIEFTVNCKDEGGVPLSTLKAEIIYTGEVVEETTIRTASEGDYTVSMKVPYLQFVPNGTAQVHLTLQNTSTKSTETEFDIAVTRPHFTDLVFVDSEGKTHEMEEDGNYGYTIKEPIDIAKNVFKGHFETADGRFTFGNDGSAVALGYDGDLSFTSVELENISVTFNTQTYAFGPQEELPIPLFTPEENTYTGFFEQGEVYEFGGDDAVFADDWYYDPDYFSKNSDGTYTFLALSGNYQIKAIFDEKSDPKGFRVHAVDDSGNPLTLSADGTGAVWIIGAAVYGKPSYYNAQGWWTDTDHDLCLAPIADKKYQVTLTVGKQLDGSKDEKGNPKFNIKFFGQPAWGTEFKGAGDAEYKLTTDNPYIGIGVGGDTGHDDGNLYLKDGVELKDGETYVFTIDLTAGCGNGVLNVEKK